MDHLGQQYILVLESDDVGSVPYSGIQSAVLSNLRVLHG